MSTHKDGLLKPLTRKQQAFVDYLLSHPKASATQAYLAAYPTTNVNTARTEASVTLAKPNVMAVLKAADKEAEAVILSVMRSSEKLKENPQHATVAERAANSVLDRLHGKATQRVESTQAVVNISIDLTQTTEN